MCDTKNGQGAASSGCSFSVKQLIRENQNGKIELVQNVSDGRLYIRRTCHEDKREPYITLKSLDCPHIPRIFSVSFGTDTVILEEYIDGISLSSLMEKGPIGTKQAKGYLRQLLKAVECIHSNGIIHRDIKPENIWIDRENRLWLIDFDIARKYRPGEQRDTELLGTPGYAAPEQFGYTQSDFRTDIFAIGMTCRQLNSKCRPSRMLRRIEQKCTRFDPQARYQSVRAILWEYHLSCLLKAACPALLLFLVLLCVYFAVQSKDAKSPRKNPQEHTSGIEPSEITLSSVPEDERLFLLERDIPCLSLWESEEKETSVSLSDTEDPVSVRAKFTKGDLKLTITAQGKAVSEFSLSNQQEFIKAYEGTSLYGEVLFYDLDGDGRKEILAAVSDRSVFDSPGGYLQIRQNYMAGFCIYQDNNGNLCQALGQLFTYGSIEVDTTWPHGFWLEEEFEAYALEDGKIVQKEW